MSQTVRDVKGNPLPGRSGPVIKVIRRGSAPGDRVALALAVPTIKPGANLDALKINDYADRRRTSFGFTKEAVAEGATKAGPGWHCTPAGLIVAGGTKACGKATCRFCWARSVGKMLNGLYARRQACEAENVPCSFAFRRDDLHLRRGHYAEGLKLYKGQRVKAKAFVDSRKAGTPAGAWYALVLLPYPAEFDGKGDDGVLTRFFIRAHEGPAVRSVMSSKPNFRQLDIPGELLDKALMAKGPLVDFFAPCYDPAELPAGESRAVRELLGSAKRVTAYGTLRDKRWRDPISGNRDDEQPGGESVPDPQIVEVPAAPESKRPGAMRPLPRTPSKPR